MGFDPVYNPDMRVVEDLWEATVWLEGGVCFEFGYFPDEMDAMVFCSSMPRKGAYDLNWVDNVRTFDGEKVWIDPGRITAMSVGHPFAYEAERRKEFWPEGYSPSWRDSEDAQDDNPDVSKPLG